jgi:hypothetical protein
MSRKPVTPQSKHLSTELIQCLQKKISPEWGKTWEDPELQPHPTTGIMVAKHACGITEVLDTFFVLNFINSVLEKFRNSKLVINHNFY